MVRKGLSPAPKSIADLKKLTLCAQAGTTGAAYIKTHIKPGKALYPSTTAIMFQQVQSKQCDASVYDVPILGAENAVQPTQVRRHRRPDRHPRALRDRVREGQQAARGRQPRAMVALTKNGTIAKLQRSGST